MEPLLADWANWQRAAGIADRTIAERASCARSLGAVAVNEPETMTRSDVLRYLGRRNLAASTRSTYHTHLRAFFAWMVEAGHRADNPMSGMPSPRRPKGVPQPVTAQNLAKLLLVLNRRKTRAMVLLIMFAGLRAAEVARVRGEDFDLDAGSLRVTGKGGKVAVIPLYDEFVRLAGDMPARGWWFPANGGAGGPITSKAVTVAMSRAMARAGFEGHGHQLRHWYGSSLVAAGVDLRTVQEVMRHENLATTQIYTLVTDEARRAGIDRLASPLMVA